jgi:hypothetical protein
MKCQLVIRGARKQSHLDRRLIASDNVFAKVVAKGIVTDNLEGRNGRPELMAPAYEDKSAALAVQLAADCGEHAQQSGAE